MKSMCFIIVEISFIIYCIMPFDSVFAKNSKKKDDELSRPPSFIIGSDSYNGVLYMDCRGQKPYYNLDCTFNNLLVDKEKDKDPKDIEKILKESENGIKKMSESEFKKTYFDDCNTLANSQKEMEAKIMTPEKKASAESDFKLYLSICDCKNIIVQSKRECVIDVIASYIKKPKNTCNIFSRTFEVHFQRIEKGKWISTSIGGGCSVVRITTIEYDPSEEYGWTYMDNIVSANIKESEICKQYASEVNKPVIYSWNAQKDMILHCDSIHLQPF